MAIANLAMATGNIGRAGRRREPAARPEQRPGRLRHGQLPARVVRLPPCLRSRRARDVREAAGASRSIPSRACASPTCSTPPIDGAFKALYIQGEDILQSDPNTQHVAAGLAAMECVVVQDLFLNETANYAHVFLPGSTFLEKDGTFTNAERRIQLRPQGDGAEERLCRLGDHPAARQCDGRSTGPTRIRPRSWTRSPRLTPTFAGVCFARSTQLGSLQWPCNEAAPEGTPVMHIDGFVARQGQVRRHRIYRRPTRRPARAFRCC